MCFSVKGSLSPQRRRTNVIILFRIFRFHTSGTTAIFLRFYKTAAAYGRFYFLCYSASGRMRNLSFCMNFEKRNTAEIDCAVRIRILHTK